MDNLAHPRPLLTDSRMIGRRLCHEISPVEFLRQGAVCLTCAKGMFSQYLHADARLLSHSPFLFFIDRSKLYEL